MHSFSQFVSLILSWSTTDFGPQANISSGSKICHRVMFQPGRSFFIKSTHNRTTAFLLFSQWCEVHMWFDRKPAVRYVSTFIYCGCCCCLVKWCGGQWNPTDFSVSIKGKWVRCEATVSWKAPGHWLLRGIVQCIWTSHEFAVTRPDPIWRKPPVWFYCSFF